MREILEDPEHRDLVNAIICSVVMKGFVKQKELDQVFNVYTEMCNHNIPRNTTSFNVMFDACARCKAMERAPGLLEDMKQQGVEPDSYLILDSCEGLLPFRRALSRTSGFRAIAG